MLFRSSGMVVGVSGSGGADSDASTIAETVKYGPDNPTGGGCPETDTDPEGGIGGNEGPLSPGPPPPGGTKRTYDEAIEVQDSLPRGAWPEHDVGGVPADPFPGGAPGDHAIHGETAQGPLGDDPPPPEAPMDPIGAIAELGEIDGWTRGEIGRAQAKYAEGLARSPLPKWITRLTAEMYPKSEAVDFSACTIKEGLAGGGRIVVLPLWAKRCLLGKVARAPRRSLGDPSSSGGSGSQIGRAHV